MTESDAMLIIPPHEIRIIVDKTAVFVAKNGPVFEERIYEKERNNPKFSFLNSNDPYHPYYTLKIEEIKTGKDQISALIASSAPNGDNSATASTEKSATSPSNTKTAPKEPPAFEFWIAHPPLAPLDLDVMRCTALFVAKNGRQLMALIGQREQKNCQFDFLKPNNVMFGYFMKLVEMYTKIIQFPQELRERVESMAQKSPCIDALMERVEYEAFLQQTRQSAKRNEPAASPDSSVDWQSFVIVETLDISPSDNFDQFLLPTTLAALESLSIADKKRSFEGIEEEVPIEETASDQIANPSAPLSEYRGIVTGKIKTDYAPSSGTQESRAQQCPVCFAYFPASEIQQHIKAELAAKNAPTPAPEVKGSAEQEAFLAQQSIENLSRFSRRSDIETRSAEATPKVVWDGTASTANVVARAAQIQAQEQRKTQAAPVPPAMPPVVQQPPFAFPAPRSAAVNMPPIPFPPMGMPPFPPGVSAPFVPGASMAAPVTSAGPPFIPGTMPPFAPGAPMPPFPAPQMPPFAPAAVPPPPFVPPFTTASVAAAQTSSNLLPEDEFLRLHPDPVTLRIQLPDASVAERPEWDCGGRCIDIRCSPQETIHEVKMRIQRETSIPVPRQRLTTPGLPPLKNQSSIAAYNLQDGAVLSVGFKERGGRK